MMVLAIALMPRAISSRAGVLQLSGAAAGRSAKSEGSYFEVLRAPPVARDRAVTSDIIALAPLRLLPPDLAPAFEERYQLQEGEQLGDIAARYGVSVASLFWANGLQSGDVLAAGQELRIARISGIPHVIQPGETLEAIAERFGVSVQAIVLFKANRISVGQDLPIGREIFIPGGVLPYPPEILARYGDERGIAAMRAVIAGVAQESQINIRTGPGREYPRLGYLDAGRRLQLVAHYDEWIKVEDSSIGVGWVRGDLLGLTKAAIDALPETNDFPPPPPRWVWPTRGELTSAFGWRTVPFRSFHDGLDLANRAGTTIVAASGGQIMRAGWCGGFGYCVEIDHGQGITTLYAHMLKRPPVVAGDSVAAGDLIGWMGNTYDRRAGGYSTGVHLHFIIKVNGKPVNPMKFLS